VQYTNRLALSALQTVYGQSPTWFNALNQNINHDASLRLAAAMSARQYDVAQVLLANHLDDTVHEVFGSPVLNAIKLRDLRMLNLLIDHFGCLGSTNGVRKKTFLNNRDSAFPIKTAVLAAIAWDDVDMLNALLEAYIKGYKKITPKILNSWLETAAKDSSVEVVQALLVFRPPQFLLGFKAMGAICRSGDYQMVNSTFNTVDHPAHPSSAQHPLHIAVRTGIVASVKAIVDTTKYKINRRLNSNIHLYPVNAITALDVAIYHDLIEIIEYLLSVGARPTILARSLKDNGRVYNLIRSANGGRRIGGIIPPPFGQFKNMSSLNLELRARN
jgi:hypothetical protein